VIGPERDDRRLVRDVFARTRIAPRPNLARRVRERVGEERRRRRPDGGWQLLVAGGALTLAMVVGLLVDDGVLQWPAGGASTSAPRDATLGGEAPGAPTFLVPPAGGGAGPLRRVDWTGRTRGSLATPAGDGADGVVASPDGALVAVRTGSGAAADVLDTAGQVVARLPAFDAWSGDGARVACALVAGGDGLRVVTTDLRDPARPRSATAAVAGLDGLAAGWTLGGCAAGSGRLVALHEPTPPVVDEAAVIALGTGRVVARVAYDDGLPPVAPVLSADARYLAENDPERGTASIRDLGSGEVVGHVAGLVTGFSGDGGLVVTDTELGPPAAASRVALVDWRWRRTVWAGAGHGVPLAARPGGQEMALEVTADPAAAPHTLLVAGGRALDLDAGPPAAGSQGA